MASPRRVWWRMCERQTEDSFAKCKTKCEVIDVCMSQLASLEKVAQQKYAIDSLEFGAYVRFKIIAEHVQRRRARCRDVNESALFSKTSLTDFAKFVTQCVRSQMRRYFLHIVVCAVVIVLVNYKTETSNAFMRNIQTFIYPVMWAWRKMTLPLIKTFPTLTNLYDETCLIENPLFRVAQLDCTPCAGIVKVIEHSASHPITYLDHSVPHVIQTRSAHAITVSSLSSFFMENRQIFRQSAYEVRSTTAGIRNLDQLFDHFLNKSNGECAESHNLWHINRMTPARILRKMFETPRHLPKNAGIGIDRYVSVDSVASPAYELPTTDCSNMFMLQASGSRHIHLQPTKECQQHCRRISIRLKPNHTLFYDWWYWKPVSAPDKYAKTTSISYIGSYC